MKRFLLLSLVAAFIMGMAMTSYAAELKVAGQYDFHFEWSDNLDFTEQDGNEDDFEAEQRTRIFFDFIANENLKGVFKIEVGESLWGQPGQGADLGADDKVIEVKNAYIQYNMPGTDLTMKVGVQGVVLPNAVAGSPILDDDIAAVVASYPITEAVSVAAYWTRLYDASRGDNMSDEIDAAGIILPVKMDGFSVTPYFQYAWFGADTVGAMDNESAWWLGAAAEVTALDPFVLKADLIYGDYSGDDESRDQAGWFFDAAVAYKMDMVTPMLVVLYSSGDDSDASDGKETMPSVSGAWGFTNLGTDGSATNGNDSCLEAVLDSPGVGAWAIGLVLDDISFVENVTHAFRAVYYAGTDDKALGGANFTTKDSAFELNFDTNYQMYENLAAIVEIGYLAANFDDDLAGRGNDFLDDSAMVFRLGLKYKF